MDTASLLVMFSSLGVMFGWQPMPDDSESYEYIVQLDPELIATLDEGQSIPISSDIPEDIGPIRRVRIVVGRGEVPRQQLVTQLKPISEEAAERLHEDIVEAQYRVPPVESDQKPRYPVKQAVQNEVVPPQSNGSSAFAQAIQRGARQSRELADQAREILPPEAQENLDNSLRNVGQQARATTEQLFGKESQGSSTVDEDPSDQAPSRYDRYAQNPSNRRQILPQNGGGNRYGEDSSNDAIMPPTDSDSPSAYNPRPDFQNDRSADAQPNEQWSASTGSGSELTFGQNNSSDDAKGQGGFEAPWPVNEANSQTQRATQTNGNTEAGSGTSPRYGNSPRYTPVNHDGGSSPDLANRVASPANSRDADGGPQFPANNSSAGDNTASTTTERLGFPAGSNTPEIRREMLEQPADADLTTASGDAVASSPPPSAQQQISNRQTSETTPNEDRLAYSNVDSKQEQDSGSQFEKTNSTMSSASGSVFPLVLSWVLLSGSGAGNLYLFWSYLDLRNKYRGLIHSGPGRTRDYSEMD